MTLVNYLLTNDDGIEAPGLAALKELVSGNGNCLVVAPSDEQSGCSHRATTHDAFKIHQVDERSFAVDGTPADCVRVGLHRFRDDFDFVLAGINAGGNLGVDAYHSGTIAAVREAALHGVPGVALSHYRTRTLSPSDWDRAVRWVRPVLGDLRSRRWEPGTLWNINVPCLAPDAADPDVVFCPLDLSPLPLGYHEEEPQTLRYRGDYHNRRRTPGQDVDVCFGGRIAVTRVRLAG